MSKYDPNIIADWILSRAKIDAGDTISPLKLQKLVYYAQAWHLAIFKDALFDEPFEAWKHGPVVRSLWERFRHIPLYSNIPVHEHVQTAPELEMKTHELLDEVMSIYGEHSAGYLETLTHNEKPWIIARGNTPPEMGSDAKISNESMIEFYSALNDNGGEKAS